MSPERWKQVEEIFQSALDLPEAGRAEFISDSCAGDAELREQVEALVAQYEEAGDFIESPAQVVVDLRTGAGVFTTGALDAPPDPLIGRRVGSYRVAREIGRGGMGAVYEAARDDGEFRQRVALKLIKRGMDTDFILRRFRNERQILATLDHPNIARLLDGGTTDDGLPYFVMEYIEGQPLYRYCDERRLSVGERLRLFCQLCGAVSYAHRAHVIHRDIKPSNVLVTSDGTPKLLDFGIAKLLNPELVGDITHDPTATAMRLMTPEYASPEQALGQPVTRATDVYSLGVLLYELLTGHKPYHLHNRAPHEIARVVCEEEPERPSEVVTDTDDLLFPHAPGGEAFALGYVYENRGSSAEDLRRELAGDLDNVVMKALRKEPVERYESAQALREDISRRLEGRPVSAPAYYPATPREAGAGGGRGGVEKSLAVLPLKLIGATPDEETDGYLGVGLADALITRLGSLRRFALRPTSSVLRFGAADADPFAAGRELGVSFVLDGRIHRAGASIRVTLQLLDVRHGSAVWTGQFDEQFTDVLQLEDAVSSQVAEALVPELTGGERLRLAKRGTDIVEAHEAYLRGRYHWSSFTEEGLARALTHFHDAVAIDPNYALPHAGIADYFNWLGVYCVMPFSETSAAAKESAVKAVALDPALAEGYAALGFATLTHDFDWRAAEANCRRAVELNPNYPTAHVWYSYQLMMEGRFDEAAAEARSALRLDPLSPMTLHMATWCNYEARRYDDAVASARRLVALEPTHGIGRLFLGHTLAQAGDFEEAIAEGTEAADIFARSPYSLSWLAMTYAAAGRAQEARAVLREIEEDTAGRYVSPFLLAMVHCGLGDTEAAFALLEEAYTIRDAWLVWLGVEPRLDALRGDARFRDLLLRTRNPAPSTQPEAAPRREPTPSNARTLPLPPGGARPVRDDGGRPAPATPAAAPAPRQTKDDEAHQLYVAGRYYATRRTAEGLRQAIERLERAVERDPSFALAFAELADCYALLNWYVEPPPADAWECAKRAARRGVEAVPTLAEAQASLGFVTCHYDRDFAAAESYLRRAVDLNPGNPVARRWHAFNLSAMGRHTEAVTEIKKARELNPRSPVMATAVANVLFLARRFDEAIEMCRAALELDPGSVAAHVVLRWAYERKGLHEEALAVFEQERIFAGETATTRAKHAHVLAAAGRTDEARRELDELVARRDSEWVTAYEIAVVLSLLGDTEAAFEWLERAGREHTVGFTFARVDPHLDPLRADPRFEELLARNGHARAALAGDVRPAAESSTAPVTRPEAAR